MATPSGFTPSGYPQPYPVKRKTSPWVWVLVALGGLLLFVVLALGGLVMFGVHKAKQAGLDTGLLKKNPGLAAAKLMVAANPDLELVSTDDERGVVVVRNKKENKLYTINMEDAKNGKFVFQEEGKPATTITTNQGDKGGVTVTTSDGHTATFGTGGKLPAWVPAYPGATVEGTYSANSDEGSAGNFTFKTSDPSGKVMSFYQEQLKAAGFKITTNSTESDGKKAGMVIGQNEGERRSVTALIGNDDGETTVNLTVVEKK